MKWLFVEIQGDSVIFRCSVCNSEISVKQGEELPYCKHCENEPDGELFNEVVKALESCIDSKVGCSKCPYLGTEIKENITCGLKMLKNALDLINRQKAKIDRLTCDYGCYKVCATDIVERQKEQIESLISEQKTLQKYIVEKDAEIEKLRKQALNSHDVMMNIVKANGG